MKCSQAIVHVIDEPDAATLETTVNTWLQGAGERTLITIQYQMDGTKFTAMITYTE